MTTSAIRTQLHNYLEIADDKKVEEIYAIVQDEIAKSMNDYSNDLKGLLDGRFASYKSGEAKMFSEEESKNNIQKILKSGIKDAL